MQLANIDLVLSDWVIPGGFSLVISLVLCKLSSLAFTHGALRGTQTLSVDVTKNYVLRRNFIFGSVNKKECHLKFERRQNIINKKNLLSHDLVIQVALLKHKYVY